MSSLLSASAFRIPLTGRTNWNRFVVAALAVFLALAGRFILEHYWPGQFSPFAFFYVAVMISAWYGGLVPGLLTMVLATAIAIYDYPPAGHFDIYRSSDQMRLALFLLTASMICILIENLHRALIRHNITARELLGTQKRVRTILQSVQGCFFSIDEEDRFLHINKDCDKHVPGDYRRFMGKSLWEAFSSWKGTEFEQKLGEAKRLKEVVEFEFHDSRTGHWYEVHIAPASDIGTSVHFYDIGPRKRFEQDLLESEDRFRRIADQAPVMIWTTDVAGVRNYVNQPWLNFRNRKLEEELGQGWEEGIHPADRAPSLKIFREAFVERRSFRKEYRWKRHDGVYRWMVSSGAPRFDAEGNFIGYVGSAMDITETRQTLKEREAFLRRHNEILVNLAGKQQFGDFQSRVGEVAQAAADGLDINRSSVWFLNESRDKLRCLDLFDRDDRRHLTAADLAVDQYPVYFDSLEKYRTIAAEDASKDPRTREFDQGYLQPNGIVSMLDAPVRLHGRTIGVLCCEVTAETRAWTLEEQGFAASLADMIALAVEERDRSVAEEALKRSEKRLRRMIDSGVIGVIYGDAKTNRITEANDVFLKMVGYTREEMNAGKLHWPSMTPPEYLEQDERKWQECVEKGWTEPFEKEYIRNDGTRVPIILGVTALDEERTQWACFVLDLSDRRLRETRQATEYAVTQVLSVDPLLSAAIPKVLQTICDGLGWDLGAFWHIPDGKALECGEVWARDPGKFSDFLQVTLNERLPSGEGLPGRTWMSGRAIWLEDLENESFPRKPQAQAAGLVSAAAFPIHFGEELLGVFEFYGVKRQASDERFLEMFEVMGSEIGQFIERKRAEEDLRLSQQHLDLALQSAQMGYWAWDLKSNTMTSSGNLEFFHGRRDGFFGGSIRDFIASVHPEDREMVWKTFEQAMADRCDYNVEFRSIWPDESVHWINARGQIFYDEDREPDQMIGLGIDITERKQTEEALEAINSQLEQMVLERTLELAEANQNLQSEIRERQKVEREALEIIQKEQKRFSAQLHDGLCQSLAGTMMLAKASVQKLEKQKVGEVQELKNVIELINQSVSEARDLARGLFPVELESNSLMLSLKGLASRSEQLFQVSCEFQCPVPILIGDNVIATHLYRIAQEAINNAVNHGEAKKLKLSLLERDGRVLLQLVDDGKGMSQDFNFSPGIGLHIMKYRARMMDAELRFEPGAEGTVFSCELPVPDEGFAKAQ